MRLHQETLAAIANEIARSTVETSNLDQHVATLMPLLDEIEKLRSLPIKNCEPRLVFVPVEA